MKTVIGIDVGGSTTKIVGFEFSGNERRLIAPQFVRANDPLTATYGAFGKFTDENGIDIGDIDRVYMTGVGSSFVKRDLYGLRCERVEEFNATLGREAYWHSAKPLGRTFRRVMSGWGLPREQVAVLGDQLLTDALGGKCLGLRVIIVPPIRDKKTAFVRFKRWLERPYMRAFYQQQNKEENT